MGSAAGYRCRTGWTSFTARDGGGFYFDPLHCGACGTSRCISHEALGDIHLRLENGRLAQEGTDRWLRAAQRGDASLRAGPRTGS